MEDKAVDLYVLERAFSSTHPDSEPMFASVLSAYATRTGKEWSAIKRRLDDGRFGILRRALCLHCLLNKCDYEDANGVWLDETNGMYCLML